MIMRRRLVDYRDIVGESKISEIYRKGSKLSKFHILQINSTYYGGGVAEILRNTVPIFNEIGVDVGWRAMIGTPDFFEVTKKFHNALHGEKINFTERKKEVFEGTSEEFSSFTHVNHDLVIVHDPQPLPLITFYRKHQPWIWRCHIDLSDPVDDVWDYLKSFILAYDRNVYQMEEFAVGGCSNDYSIIQPSIDPLTTKNQELDEATVDKYLSRINVDTSRPIISQISRFDKWKDPSGVLEVYKQIKKEMDCQLVMAGSMATDDPEGQEVYDRVSKEAEKLEDVHLIVDASDITVNAIQNASDVVIQKSLKEGFALTVAESLWKETPVVGSNVGGIPTQVVDGKTGYLVDPTDYDEAAKKVMDLLSDETLRKKMGQRGKERVRKKFLITRQIDDWLNLWMDFLA
ncbi:glycosyl transferase family 1 [candidate division MSBL1 archaeon SCGC-AAA259E19]|uniref:Glycosyl transferase family 1 n=2 Tax=candidate division MSBL1 TaxID=215777 RepID=A0A133V5P6_9EURY|nr:glycosyl transferase family 1 [candidate division MSBL1 archaeon SCGC-AAA259E19]KXB01768.1 glycosyl transferase family 1 [candidate division MSBL1 archaeon SCGC-AAA259O05]